MKNFEVKKESLIWVIMILPMLYLYHVWATLPEIVPTHFNMEGQPNDWSHKITLVYLIAGLLVGCYVLFTIIPVIDPKGKIEAMGNKYFLLKLFIMLFFSAICFLITNSAITKNIGNGHLMFLLVGGLFVFLGNFMQTFKPNYFIGIRTPWTLESEIVWRKTHRLGGKLYFIAGILIMTLPFLLEVEFYSFFIFIVLTASFIPIIYSYILFRQEKKVKDNEKQI